jgi:hypothetical protein
MIRLILFALVGLLAGLGGGSGFAVLRAKKSFAAQDAYRAKVVADSIAESTERVAPASHTPATQDSAVAPDSAARSTIAGTGQQAKSTDSASHAPSPGAVPGAVAEKKVVAEAGAAHPGTSSAPSVAGANGTKGAAPTSASTATVGAATAGVTPPAATDTEAGAALPPGEGVQPRRISKIFAAMAPKDAAKVLAQLDNMDVQAIIGSLNDKQAAAILTNFPPERAAIISRNAMRGASKP